MCEELKTLRRLWQSLQKESGVPVAEEHGMNIFKVLHIQNKEVLTCRLLGELLDPMGSHNMGILPLSVFLKIIQRENYSEMELQKATVTLEEVIDENRRVDIVVRIGADVLPIEVKIDAVDQNAQLVFYYRHYFGKDSSRIIYYLTPNAHLPSDNSKGDLSIGEQIRCLSFGVDILNWLELILPHSLDNNTSTILKQFKEMVSSMSTEYKKLADFLSILQPDGNGEFAPETVFALNMMNHADEILRHFRYEYLKKIIIGNDNYSFVYADTPDKTDIDSHVLLRVLKEDQVVAWICVDTNIYLSAKKVFPKFKNEWSGKDGFRWIYLHPNGPGKKLNLKNPEWDKLPNRQIDITSYLDQIEFE